MNAKGSAPQLGWKNHYLSRQLVLMRDNRPLGRKIKIHINNAVHPSGAHVEHRKGIHYSETPAQSSKSLRDYGRTLTVSATKLCTPVSSFLNKKSVLQHVHLLKDQNTEMDAGEKTVVFFTTLKPFDRIKRAISNVYVSLCATAKTKDFNQSHNYKTMLTHNAKATIISHRVEHAASRILARALAFDYFQGSHYSPADNI